MSQGCCSVFSKYWIMILSIILLLLGGAIIILSFFFFNLDEVVPNEDAADVNKIFTWVIVGLGALLIELSILGIILVYSKNKCISLIYSIELIVLFIIFLAGAIGVYIGFQKASDKINCKDLDILEDADKIFNDGSSLLCSNYCRCMAKKDWLQEYLDKNNKNYEATTGVVRVQDCKNYQDYLGGSHENLIKSVKWIEENLECSGICTMPPYYLYSDINSNTKPKKACLDSIKDKMKDISYIITCVLGGIALVLLITLICNFVICCSGKQKKKKEDEDKYKVQEQQQYELYPINK